MSESSVRQMLQEMGSKYCQYILAQPEMKVEYLSISSSECRMSVLALGAYKDNFEVQCLLIYSQLPDKL